MELCDGGTFSLSSLLLLSPSFLTGLIINETFDHKSNLTVSLNSVILWYLSEEACVHVRTHEYLMRGGVGGRT